MRGSTVLLLLCGINLSPTLKSQKSSMDLSTKSIELWAMKFGQEFIRIANSVMKPELLLQAYKEEGAKVQHYKPEETLDIMAKERLSTYLTERKLVAQKLKQSLENGNSVYKKIELKSNKEWKCYHGTVAEKLQCLAKHTNYTRIYDFVDARTDKDTVETLSDYMINDSANPNFYNLLVDTTKSAVHVPVPVYKYDPFLLEEIYWSGSMLDNIFEQPHQSKFPVARWQLFCSQEGFLRFYPAMKWHYDTSKPDRPDLYDCRNSEWFIDGATAAKNILILLDISGSMTGQRYEIAKHTISVIFNTLSENDFFNVIRYNQTPSFLLPCFSNTLVQATLKHKKLLLDELSNEELRPEGHADLDKVWGMAAKALKDVDSKSKFGCNTAIMLLTDASVEFSPGNFRDVFGTKNLRFFSFVVGGDVKESDVKAVQKLACDNYGSMIRIHNLADAQQKVQNYIDVMSKTVAQGDQNRTIWTGVYSDDHMSQKLVSTVAFAVVTNSIFRGVVGVTAPIIGLQQMAAVYMLGVNAYSFLVDNNGYVIFHPQHRPFYNQKQVLKPNFNSMDIMELEVPIDNSMIENGTMQPIPVDYNKPLRIALADGNSSELLDEFSMKVLVALSEDERIVTYCIGGKIPFECKPLFQKRVYKQENIYYFRGLQDTSMTLGLAVPRGSDHIVDFAREMDLRKVDLSWFEGENWRLHPDWQYCLPNYTSRSLSKETIIRHYMEQFRTSGKYSEKCKGYEYLVRRLLWDAKVTSKFMKELKKQAQSNKAVVSTFLATQSGLTRYEELNLDNELIILRYDATTQDGNSSSDTPTESKHFLTKHARGLDETFYRRSTLNADAEYVIDVDINDYVNLTNNSAMFEIFKLDRIPLIRTTKTIKIVEDKNEAVIGVIGFEMIYFELANLLNKVTGNICRNSGRYRCYLLDEHGYVVYASMIKDFMDMTKYLGKFFGHIQDDSNLTASIEAYIFNKLVAKQIYENLTYVDYQSVCPKPRTSSAARFIAVYSAPCGLLIRIMSNIFLCIILSIMCLRPVSLSSKDAQQDISPCTKWSPFYLLNKEIAELPIELFNGRIDCKSFRCEMMSSYATRVPSTNLLLLVIKTDPLCNLQSCSALRSASKPWFEMKVDSNVRCDSSDSRYRRLPSTCPMNVNETLDGLCGSANHNQSSSTIALLMYLFYFLFYNV